MTAKEILDFIIPGIITIVAGLIVRYLRTRPKVVYWFPHIFFFNLEEGGVTLSTYSLTIQNVGRETAEDVEIIHNARPDFMSLHPSVPFEEEPTPLGEHVIRFKSLGPKEHIFIQMLNYKTPTPTLLNIRSKAGRAKNIPVHLQQVFPKWVLQFVGFLILLGAWVITYWAYKGIVVGGKAFGLW